MSAYPSKADSNSSGAGCRLLTRRRHSPLKERPGPGLGEAYTEICFGRVCPFMLTGMMSSVSRVCVCAIDVLAVLSGAVILAVPFILVVAAPFYFGI